MSGCNRDPSTASRRSPGLRSGWQQQRKPERHGWSRAVTKAAA